jgi:hypothetical protein
VLGQIDYKELAVIIQGAKSPDNAKGIIGA